MCDAAAAQRNIPLLYVVSCIVPVAFVSIVSIVIFVHFCSGLTQYNGCCRIDDIAAYPVISLGLDGFASFFFFFRSSGGRSKVVPEEIIRRLILRFLPPCSTEIDETKDLVISVE